MPRRSNLHLPSRYFCSVYRRAYEYPAVPIVLEFEIQIDDKIFIMFVGREISVSFVGPTLANQFTVVNIPLLRSMNGPALQVFSIKEVFGFLRINFCR